ncbi:MAG: hypothetical protein ACK5LK_06000 [Chthoniobacterales bacterium]
MLWLALQVISAGCSHTQTQIKKTLQSFSADQSVAGQLHRYTREKAYTPQKITFVENSEKDLFIQLFPTSNSLPELRILFTKNHLFVSGTRFKNPEKWHARQNNPAFLGWQALAMAYLATSQVPAGKTEIRTAVYDAVYTKRNASHADAALEFIDVFARDTDEQFAIRFFRH